MNANGKPKALLLEDDPTALRLLATALEARGFEVRAAMDGESGIALLIDELLDLDVLVVDLDLPGRDAASLLHLVRHAGGERDLAVAVLGDRGDGRVRDQLFALGADAVIDRRDGHAAEADAIRALARRTSEEPRRNPAPSPTLQGALLVARAALAPRLAPAPA